MTSVTHNAAETNGANKSSKGLLSKLRASTNTTKTGNTNRQTKPTATQSFVAPKTGISQSFTLEEKDADGVSALTRQHEQQRRIFGGTSSMQPIQQYHQKRSGKSHTFNRSSSMPDPGPPVAKESAVRAVRRGSATSVTSRGSSVSSNSSRERRRGIDYSDRTKQTCNSSRDNDSNKFEPFYSEDAKGISVMGQQPPPPARRNGSYTGPKQDDYVSPATSGNPSWFTEEPVQRRGSGGILKNNICETMYSGSGHTLHTKEYHRLFGDDSTVSDSTVSTLTTARTLDTMPTVQTNEESIGNTTISTLSTEGTGSTMPSHTNATSLGAYRDQAIDEVLEMQVPTGEVTILYADVKADNLWETCPDAMQEAQDIYDIIMRRCYADHRGYEISSGGVSFNLAFQNPVDALAFALQAQVKLYNALWPEALLKHIDGKHEPALKLKGLRVRIGMHHGQVITRTNESTGRTLYVGEGVNIAKSVASLCHGGQILATSQTWNLACGMRERCLGRPQAVDCGEHCLFEIKVPAQGSAGHTTMKKVCRQLIQLTPYELSFNFGAARGRTDPTELSEVTIKDSSSVFGRLFPPVPSLRQLTTSFLNAPFGNGRVTLCVVRASGINRDDYKNTIPNLSILSKHIKKQILQVSPPGYECVAEDGQWILAFDRMVNGVTFGLQLKKTLHQVSGLRGTVDKEGMFKTGIISGAFTSMSPNPVTGKAEYFGPIVNRTQFLANNCEPGQVCVGIPLKDGDTADAPDFGAAVKVRLVEMRRLPNMKNAIAIFECKKRNIDMPYA